MTIKKSQDAKFQLHFWSRLLDSRIALQKVVVASREFEKANIDGVTKSTADDATIKSVSKLLINLVKLRDTYRCKSQFNIEENDPIEDSQSEKYSEVDDSILDAKHDNYNEIRNGTIEKWCEKTRIGTIPKKGYTALEIPTLQLIQNALKDKERLIRRTRLDRTNHLDDAVHPETFNDDDFYHQLLKEVISKDDGRKWVELQRLKYKNKRKADTKATKGRKIKKDLIPKLVNFMAPSRPMNMQGKDEMSEQIRNELLKSIFGGSVKQTIQSETS